MKPQIDVIFQRDQGCGEGPFWSEDEQVLYSVDIPGCTVNSYEAKTGKNSSTKIDGVSAVSFVIPVAGKPNHFLVGVDLTIGLLHWEGQDGVISTVQPLASSCFESPGSRFNDAKCDPSGRLWVGSMGPEGAPGEILTGDSSFLHTLEPDGNMEIRLNKVVLSNGLDWSKDMTKFYYIDSSRYQVDVYDCNITTGSLCNRRCLLDFKSEGLLGIPDGMTIDEEGHLWVATFSGKRVLRVHCETGAVISSLELPVPNVTSCCFGGKDLDTLFVTTASKYSDMKKYPLGGSIFKVTGIGVRGLRPGVPANIAILNE
ncbi:unnamed protein product [Cyprideis torosa]|uniref:Regucalcin n=1 Tax=Cyprideis torosa TaxID=163714 RepID=A0A7R8WC72_9CRUS|nr:unnamed protein product [Cyprideis torosa]CAG0888143.1 unnamed protein product [Cyprideis torosa]